MFQKTARLSYAVFLRKSVNLIIEKKGKRMWSRLTISEEEYRSRYIKINGLLVIGVALVLASYFFVYINPGSFSVTIFGITVIPSVLLAHYSTWFSVRYKYNATPVTSKVDEVVFHVPRPVLRSLKLQALGILVASIGTVIVLAFSTLIVPRDPILHTLIGVCFLGVLGMFYFGSVRTFQKIPIAQDTEQKELIVRRDEMLISKAIVHFNQIQRWFKDDGSAYHRVSFSAPPRMSVLNQYLIFQDPNVHGQYFIRLSNFEKPPEEVLGIIASFSKANIEIFDGSVMMPRLKDL